MYSSAAGESGGALSTSAQLVDQPCLPACLPCFDGLKFPCSVTHHHTSSRCADSCCVRLAMTLPRATGGRNNHGRVKVPSDLAAVLPGKPVPLGVSVGEAHSCAVLVTGAVQCWGDNTRGQSTPPKELPSVYVVVAGRDHTCAIETATQRPHCWGCVRAHAPSVLGSRS